MTLFFSFLFFCSFFCFFLAFSLLLFYLVLPWHRGARLRHKY